MQSPLAFTCYDGTSTKQLYISNVLCYLQANMDASSVEELLKLAKAYFGKDDLIEALLIMESISEPESTHTPDSLKNFVKTDILKWIIDYIKDIPKNSYLFATTTPYNIPQSRKRCLDCDEAFSDCLTSQVPNNEVIQGLAEDIASLKSYDLSSMKTDIHEIKEMLKASQKKSYSNVLQDATITKQIKNKNLPSTTIVKEKNPEIVVLPQARQNTNRQIQQQSTSPMVSQYKRVHIYISGYDPSVTPDALTSHLLEKLPGITEESISSEKLESKSKFYSSFHVIAPFSLHDTLHDKNFWAPGLTVRRFNFRKPNPASMNPPIQLADSAKATATDRVKHSPASNKSYN